MMKTLFVLNLLLGFLNIVLGNFDVGMFNFVAAAFVATTL